MKNILLGMVSCLFLVTSVHGLDEAIKNNDLAAVKADVQERRVSANDVLKNAVLYNNLEAVKLALQAGANVNEKIKYPYLCLAAKSGRLEIVKFLLDQPGVEVDLPDQYGDTPLCGVVSKFAYGCSDCKKKKVYDEIIDLLIKKGADLNAQFEEADSPISTIIEYLDIPEIQEYLNKGAQVNPKSENETPPIFAVAGDEKNWREKLEFLIKNGADITKTDQNGETLLHRAVKENFYLMRYLIEEKKVDVTTKDKNGHDALYHACLAHDDDTSALEYILYFKILPVSIDTILDLIEVSIKKNYSVFTALEVLGRYSKFLPLPPQEQTKKAITEWNKNVGNYFSKENILGIIRTLYPD